MSEIFTEYKAYIVFIHVISAVVWVGGMIAMRYAAHPSFMKIESSEQRLEHISIALKRLFLIVLPFVVLLFITAFIMIKAYSLSGSEYAGFAHAKEAIWSVMFINLIVMIKRRNRAEKAIVDGDIALAKSQLGLIGKYQVPANIVLGVIAIFIGSYLSSIF
ncbi:hypothetical protein [Sulfurimonas sp.]|uniref:hypothetical protein n=1 Tax=Sulfurimonas sp. TaxID=2022749 RepID=UPI0035654252